MLLDFQYTDKLYSKNGLSCIFYAQMLLSKSLGDRIETVAYYAQQMNVGRGTIQYAMQFLAECGAAQFEARGHKGTFVTFLDYTKLFEISGIGAITCSMPLPYTLRYEGLATGLCNVFASDAIDFHLLFSRGSFHRVQQLQKGNVDFTVVSNYTANHFLKEHDNLVLVQELDAFSFVGKRAILFREKHRTEIEDGMRVAYDASSLDQVALTKHLCKGKQVTFVKLSYNQIYNYLNENLIDAAVWNGDEFTDKKIKGNTVFLEKAPIDDTSAAILGHRQKDHLNQLMKKVLNKTTVQEIQQKVLQRELIPSY